MQVAPDLSDAPTL